MAIGVQFGFPKITFDRIYRPFISIHNSLNILTKWPSTAILADILAKIDREFPPWQINTYIKYEVMTCTNIFVIFSSNSKWFFHAGSSMAVSNMNLIWASMSTLREIQYLACREYGGADGSGTEKIISTKCLEYT